MRPSSTLRLGWFATGTGATSPKLLSAVLGAIQSQYLRAEIVAVFCNREPGEDIATEGFHSVVQQAQIPLVTLSDRRFRHDHGGEPARKGDPLPPWRLDYDREVIRLLMPYGFDIGVLAGYKLIFGPEAAGTWDLLNLHPAQPGGPKGIWQDVIWELIAARADRAGVMIHLATPKLDEGPPVTYCTYPVRGPTFDDLWQRMERSSIAAVRATEGEETLLFQAIRSSGVAREVPLVIETLRAIAEGHVRIQDKRVVDATGTEIAAVNLTDVIESLIATAT